MGNIEPQLANIFKQNKLKKLDLELDSLQKFVTEDLQQIPNVRGLRLSCLNAFDTPVQGLTRYDNSPQSKIIKTLNRIRESLKTLRPGLYKLGFLKS